MTEATTILTRVGTPADMQRACQQFAARSPLLANMVEGGQTPLTGVGALQALGFRIVIFPGGTVRFLAHQLQRYFATLKTDGSTAALQGQMHDFDSLNAVIGTPDLLELGRRYGN